MLKNPGLTMNQRNSVVMRRGEKQVYHYYIKLAETCSAYLKMQWKDLKKIVIKAEGSDAPMDAYITSVVGPLVRKN